MSLAVYMPSQYLHQSKVSKYAGESGGNLTMVGRETGIRKLMNTNLLKRLESSVTVHEHALLFPKEEYRPKA